MAFQHLNRADRRAMVKLARTEAAKRPERLTDMALLADEPGGATETLGSICERGIEAMTFWVNVAIGALISLPLFAYLVAPSLGKSGDSNG